MSKLITNTVRHTAGSADNITLDNSQNVTVEGNLTVDGTTNLTGAVTLPAGTTQDTLSFRNKIVNGAMQINQRGTRTAGTSNGYYACDRWRTFLWDIGTYTIQQDTDAPEGFKYSLKWDCTTADTSVAAGSRIGVRYILEGDDLQDLKYGTSNAESMTLSFWIKSTVTGTAAVRFKNLNSGGTKIIGQNVTISAANTWEKKTVTIAGDTAAAIEGGNGPEYEIFIFFNAGTNYTSGAVPTSWEADTDADLAAGANIAINNSTSNNIWLTGVQWEKGSTATDFEYRSYGDDLIRCERYYQIKGGYGGLCASASVAYLGGSLNPTMRSAPAIGQTAALAVNDNNVNATQSSTGLASADANVDGFFIAANNFSSLTSSNPCLMKVAGKLTFDAEM